MKRKLVSILLVIVFIIGFGILSYPTFADQWNTYRQNRLISSYEDVVENELTDEDFERLWAEARAYNKDFHINSVYSSEFAMDEEADGDLDSQAALADTEYGRVLNVAGDGVMGYISIPKIDIKLAIYHGVGSDILQTGVGHMAGTGLPIGGESNHSVLAAHRGLPSAKLFTDIDQLEVGDEFYITVLDETLAYEVEQIYPMVDKDDTEQLTEILSVQEGRDLVTLFTCTPYGVNSHRLMVQGHRVDYIEEPKDGGAADTLAQAVGDYYMFFLAAGIVAVVVAVLIIRSVLRRKTKRPE